MEYLMMKSSCNITAAAAFIFFLILFITPCFSRGMAPNSKMNGEEVYVIDYRGPETHSYFPPPNRSGGVGGGHHPHVHHPNVVVLHRESKDLMRPPNINAKGSRAHATGKKKKNQG